MLDWGGEPLAAYQVRQLLEVGLECIVVVLGYEAEAVAGALASLGGPRLLLVTNEAYAQGKVGSVLRGLRALDADTASILVLSVDQPRPAGLLDAVLTAHQANSGLITVPRYQGYGGHPTVFSGSLYLEMLSINEETFGLRALVQRHRDQVQYVDIDDPLVVLDVNDERAYAAARAAFQEKR